MKKNVALQMVVADFVIPVVLRTALQKHPVTAADAVHRPAVTPGNALPPAEANSCIFSEALNSMV
ncbi:MULTISPECIES: hypothetical protein [Kosakonia]|uniref:Uncharacterized protein n=1 Tax=Kosakonia quasisacchari TaxID=2529380 RepID=A0A4R0HHY0_9ENTR|nr:hypothetical protein [Kosakonia quasisacchari]TCC09230.1 hypothetical protein E0L21_10435 [Kosakonia quasisacchari]